MAIVVGTNSWVTIVEADAYLTDRIEAEDWFTLSDSAGPGEVSKTSLLVTSFNWLIGSAMLEIAKSSTDDNVKNAQIEAALHLQKHYTELDDRRANIASGLKAFKFSERSETLDWKTLGIPIHILGFLRAYQQSNVFATLSGEYDLLGD
jgi:hypothetical protein